MTHEDWLEEVIADYKSTFRGWSADEGWAEFCAEWPDVIRSTGSNEAYWDYRDSFFEIWKGEENDHGI